MFLGKKCVKCETHVVMRTMLKFLDKLYMLLNLQFMFKNILSPKKANFLNVKRPITIYLKSKKIKLNTIFFLTLKLTSRLNLFIC